MILHCAISRHVVMDGEDFFSFSGLLKKQELYYPSKYKTRLSVFFFPWSHYFQQGLKGPEIKQYSNRKLKVNRYEKTLIFYEGFQPILKTTTMVLRDGMR